jgi:predicted DNA-binding transcriptional regulator AlpA
MKIYRFADAIEPAPAAPGRPEAPDSVPRLLWGWPEILTATGLLRRTLERELAAGRFPAPVRRVGRRPFWSPEDVIAWARGGQP